MLHKSDWTLVGRIGIDAGICWIGDPCYILHKGKDLPNSLGKNWDEFCEKLGKSYPTIKCFDYSEGMHSGLGCVVSTGYGDGYYPVYALIKGNRCVAVLVDFDGYLFADEQEEEYDDSFEEDEEFEEELKAA